MSIFKHYKKSYGLLDKKIRWFLVLTAALLSIVSMLDLIGLSLIFPIAKLLSGDNSFLMREELSFIQPVIENVASIDLARALSIGLVVLLILKGIIATAITYWTSKTILLAESRFTSRLFAAYVKAPLSYHLAHNSSEFIRNLNQNVVGLFRSTALPLAQTVAEIVLSAGMIAVLIYADPWAALVSILILGFGGGGYGVLISKPMSHMAFESHDVSMQTVKVMHEAMESVSVIRVFDKANFFTNAYERLHRKLAIIAYKQQTIANAPRFILEALIGVMIMSIILILLSSGRDGEDVMTILILYAVAAIRLMPVVTRVVMTVNSARIAIPAVVQLSKDVDVFGRELVIDKPWTSPSSTSLVPGQIPGFKNELDIRNISHFFSDDQAALDDVSLLIKPGDSIGLVGHSGAGKTTLANVMLGLVHPSKGDVLIDGISMDLDESAISRSIGFVPQHIIMLDDSVRANVAFGLKAEEIDDVHVRRALEQADLLAFVETLPEGLDTRVGERGMLLSGGQRQRLGVARALYYDPAILVLDEATSALDVETEARISEVIQQLSGEKTLIIIAHRLSTVKNCDRIVFMKDGSVVDVGTFKDLIERSSDFRTLVEHARLGVHDADQSPNAETIL